MQARPGTVAVAALLMFSFAGCLDQGAGRFAGPTGVPLDAPSEVGDGDFEVQVKVVAETAQGQPLAGAPIVVHHIPKPASAPSVPQLLAMNASMGGRTDDQGVLRAHLTKGQTYSFLTAIPNWTTEARHLVKITDEFKDKPLYIAVFHTGQTLEHKGKIPITVRPDTPIINLGYANAKWWPVEVRFSEDNATNRNYLFRLHRFEATLTVTNEPGTYANIMFRAVLSGDSGNPFVYDVRGSQIPPPPQNVKRINLLPADLANIATIRNPVLRIGPMSFESSAGPSCIPWDMQIETGFDNAPRPAPRRSYYYGYGPDAAAIPQPPGAC